MKIAVMAGNLNPAIGGGASLCRTLCGGIAQTPVGGEQDSLVFFVEGKEFPQFLPQLGEVVVCRARDLASCVGRHGVGMAWFMSGGGLPPPLPLPYLATVWDLQHRTHPYLPEMQKKGEWAFREESTRPFLQQAAKVVVGTRAGAREITLFYGVPEEKIHVIPYPVPDLAAPGVDFATDYRTRSLQGLQPPFFIYPAQFWAHKNHVVVVRALARLQAQGIRCQVVFPGGDGGNLAFVRRLAEELRVIHSVVFPGFLPGEDLERLYRNSQGLLFPSLSGPDNLPPLEALRAGISVLQTDSPGAREQLGTSAVYLDPFDEKAWAQAMQDELDPKRQMENQLRKQSGSALVGQRTPRTYLEQIRSHLQELKKLSACWDISRKS